MLILDEARSAIDTEHRQKIGAALRRLRKVRPEPAILRITHDLTSSVEVDRIYVMGDGRIAEHGAPANLATRSGDRFMQILTAADKTAEPQSAELAHSALTFSAR